MKKTRSWSEYNESLVNRGSITFWFGDDVLELWNHQNKGYRRGRPLTAIRQSKRYYSFVKSFIYPSKRRGVWTKRFSLLGARDANVPDYTSLCKSSKTPNISVKVAGKRSPLDAIVDNTGLKFMAKASGKIADTKGASIGLDVNFTSPWIPKLNRSS